MLTPTLLIIRDYHLVMECRQELDKDDIRWSMMVLALRGREENMLLLTKMTWYAASLYACAHARVHF